MNKIDIIIDVLEIAANEVESAYVASHIAEALAAARELRELKPVAWCSLAENGSMNYSSGKPMIMVHQIDHEPNEYMETPLYALDEETK